MSARLRRWAYAAVMSLLSGVFMGVGLGLVLGFSVVNRYGWLRWSLAFALLSYAVVTKLVIDAENRARQRAQAEAEGPPTYHFATAGRDGKVVCLVRPDQPTDLHVCLAPTSQAAEEIADALTFYRGVSSTFGPLPEVHRRITDYVVIPEQRP